MQHLSVGSHLGIHIILSKAISDLFRSIKTVLSILKDVDRSACPSRLLSKSDTGSTGRGVGNRVRGTQQNHKRRIWLPGTTFYTAKGIAQAASGIKCDRSFEA